MVAKEALIEILTLTHMQKIGKGYLMTLKDLNTKMKEKWLKLLKAEVNHRNKKIQKLENKIIELEFELRGK